MRTATTMLGIALVMALSGYGQTTSGSIAGSVVDAQHAAVPNAAVTALEQEKQVTFTAKSDEAGRFVFAQVPPGTYTLNVAAAGFKKYERRGITLNANDKRTLGEIAME